MVNKYKFKSNIITDKNNDIRTYTDDFFLQAFSKMNFMQRYTYNGVKQA